MFNFFQKIVVRGVYEEVPASSNLLPKHEEDVCIPEDVDPGEKFLSASRLLFYGSLVLFALSFATFAASKSFTPSDNECARQLSVWCRS
jgi:hypothetical protein